MEFQLILAPTELPTVIEVEDRKKKRRGISYVKHKL